MGSKTLAYRSLVNGMPVGEQQEVCASDPAQPGVPG